MSAVRAVGKHLLMEFSGHLVLRTHMRMSGSWHVYRPGERWQRPRAAMRIVVGNTDYVAITFDVPVAEFLAARELGRHRELASLGPDLLAADLDVAAVTARLRGAPRIGDRRRAARPADGVGRRQRLQVRGTVRLRNRPVPARRHAQRRPGAAGRGASRELLRANVTAAEPTGAPAWGGSRRTTRRMDPTARLWVYGRAGKPCRNCGTAVACRTQGADARLTYWCPRCQG